MQNKGFVKVFALLLTLVCVFYLSFSFVTTYQMNKVDEITKTQGEEAGAHYLDSVMNNPVWLGAYSLKDCREMEISLGLDLKGGMNVILEVSVPEVVKALADHKEDPAFNKAVAKAAEGAKNSQSDFITLFVKEYKALAPDGNLAELFATQQLKGKVTTKSSDSEVEKVLRAEVQSAIDNSYNVLRTRIDRFGVVQPNIQTLEGQMGRIMVEMPGVKEPERVRKLLQGSANLEFWETYNTEEIIPFLATLDTRLAAEHAAIAENDTVKADTTAMAELTPAEKVDATDSTKKAPVKDLAAALKGNSGTPAEKAGAAVDEQAMKNHPLASVLQLAQGPMGCVVGYASWRDTATVNRYITSAVAKEVLPSDLKLYWGVKPVGSGNMGDIFELYAIKITERNGRAPLEGDVVTEAKDDYEQNGRPCVSMTMNSDGARRWAALTKKNVKRAIAIVLDGYVYSAPTVQNEITGGVSSITGHFTLEDTRDLANVLNTGKMPAPAHIVSEQFVGPTLGPRVHQPRYYFICDSFHPVDGLYVWHVWSYPRYGSQRRVDIELLLYVGGFDFIPGCIDHVRYCRYGAFFGYGGRCERVDI